MHARTLPCVQLRRWISSVLQVPDAADDLLAAAVLDQQPPDRLSQQAREALAALPELFPITVSAVRLW